MPFVLIVQHVISTSAKGNFCDAQVWKVSMSALEAWNVIIHLARLILHITKYFIQWRAKFSAGYLCGCIEWATGWTVRCFNPATPLICLNGNSRPKLGDVVGNNLEKSFGLRLSFMAIFLLLQWNKCRFHKSKNC